MHTPDPWRIGKDGCSVVTDHPVGQKPEEDSVRDYYCGSVICETVTPSNTRLICQAPVMLELLRELYLHYRRAFAGHTAMEVERVIQMADGVRAQDR